MVVRDRLLLSSNSRARLHLQSDSETPAAGRTFILQGFVISPTNELLVRDEVELIAGLQLPMANETSKARQVIHELIRTSNHLGRRDPIAARSAGIAKLSKHDGTAWVAARGKDRFAYTKQCSLQ